MPDVPIVPDTANRVGTQDTPAEGAADASFHTVAYPRATARLASVSCATTAGFIRVAVSHQGRVESHLIQPDSPAYNLGNKSCSLPVVVPLGAGDGEPEVVSVTFTNNSGDEGHVLVVAAVSYPPEENQPRVYLKRKLLKGQSTFFHLVFNPV